MLANLGLSLEFLGTLAGAVLVLAGVAVLRASWLGRSRQGWHLVAGGWLLIVAGLAAFDYVWGGEVGTAYGLLALSVAAYAVVAAGVDVRTGKARGSREVALEPDERPTNWPRAIAKALLAIVLAGIASIGIGVAFAVAMPMGIHDRIVIGGLLVPILWGAGMAWTLCDAKLIRATVVLVSVSAAGYAIAFLPKVLS